MPYPEGVVNLSEAKVFDNDDIVVGFEGIAKAINKTPRQVIHLCETRQIPAFKFGGRWHLRLSTYRQHIANIEAEAVHLCTNRNLKRR
jgi:hypothetical protein